jgi:uncharacterized protein YdeI (YjbR/CyaY-like superfamily)
MYVRLTVRGCRSSRIRVGIESWQQMRVASSISLFAVLSMTTEQHKGINAFHAASREEWRQWLDEHHATEQSVWLILYHKSSAVPSVYYPEAVDEALCYGWIDSKPNKRDEQSYYTFFSKRKPQSNWSRINKEKVARLLQEKRMMPAGLAMIELAKQTGTWTALDCLDQVPADLQRALDANPTALQHWNAFPPSARRGILEWILNAKRPVTRQKRIDETVTKASQNIRANH